MPFAKGHKLGKGRPKGSPNKTTAQIREIYIKMFSQNSETFEKQLKTMMKTNPMEAMDLMIKFTQFILPKLQTTSVDLTTSTPIQIILPKDNSKDSK